MIPTSNRYGVIKDGLVTFTGNKKNTISFKNVWGGTVYDGAYNWNVGDKKNETGN